MSVLLARKSTAAWFGRTVSRPLVCLSMSSAPDAKKSKTVHSLLAGKRLVSIENSIRVHGESGVQFLDGSWFLKDRNGREEFEKGPRIPGAHYFDIDQVASTGDLNPKGLPHMRRPAELFATAMDAMGIVNDDHLIVYATKGCVSVFSMYVVCMLFHASLVSCCRSPVALLDDGP